MRRFIIFLLILIVSVFLGLKIAEDPGFAFISYHNWTVEMPLWAAVVAALLLFYVGHTLLGLFDRVDFSLFRFRNWLRWRRMHKAYNKTNRGLIELIEGNWSKAEGFLLEGIPQSDAPLINYLAAAKAAHEREAYDKRDTYLRKAYAIAPHAELAIGLMQTQLQLDQGQLEQALATLSHLRSIAPQHKFVLKLLERLTVRLGDWQALLDLLPSLRKAKVVDSDQVKYFEAKIYQELLKASDNKNVQQIQNFWESIPKNYREEPELIACYVTKLLPYSELASEVEPLLAKTIKKTGNKELIRLYGLFITAQPAKQLAMAEGWLKQFPNQAMLYLTLGRLCVLCQLWGKAREYFEASLKLEVNLEAYVELGKLLEAMGEQSAAAENYRDGLRLMSEV